MVIRLPKAKDVESGSSQRSAGLLLVIIMFAIQPVWHRLAMFTSSGYKAAQQGFTAVTVSGSLYVYQFRR